MPVTRNSYGVRRQGNYYDYNTGAEICPLCGIGMESSASFFIHMDEPRHGYNYTLAMFQRNRIRKAKNRHGVEVNVHCEERELRSTKDGTVKTMIVPEKKSIVYQFEVKNVGPRHTTPVKLKRVMLLHPYEAFRIEDVENISNGREVHLRIKSGEMYQVKVTFTNCGIGTYGVPVCFTFERETIHPSQEFDIIRMMVINVIDPTHVEETLKKEESPFTAERWVGMDVTVRGKMLNGKGIKRLLEYSIPGNLRLLFKQHLQPWEGIDLASVENLYRILTMFNYSDEGASGGGSNLNGPDVDNYAEFFHTLLYMEEFDAAEKLEQYNMEHVPLVVVNETRLKLEVSGLAERRPSVLPGDMIHVRVSMGKHNVERIQYECIVAEVRDTCVWIGGFNPELMSRIEDDSTLHFDVHFTLNRFSLYVMHRAIDLVEEEDLFEFVFPPDRMLSPLHTRGPLTFINPLIQKNPEQRKAVTNIVLGTSRPAPYIIFGPPGTGKTVTVVEAILQIKKELNSYILVCAPANAACDLLAQKLKSHCTTKELLRLHSSTRDWSTVPVDIHPYSNRSENLYYMPKTDELHSYRIIVCTLISAGRLLAQKRVDDDFYDRTHFTHVFIDECGQAMEPAALVPFAGILGRATDRRPGGQIILAGDPMQLGPVCDSRKAEQLGLGLSLMERLMNKWHLYMRENCKEEKYNDRFITRLRLNFRSHKLILKLPNKLFYNGELVEMVKVSTIAFRTAQLLTRELVWNAIVAAANTIWDMPQIFQRSKCGQDVINDTVKNLKNNPNVDLPVVFDGVIGRERREGRSPSYYNNYELCRVLSYVKVLLTGGVNRAPVEQSEIGIIAPYMRQVYKLKGRLKDSGWEKVEVGTTETFQGREKRVIIISTVRSNRNLLDYDAKFRLGFVANAKRFNVAVTRACSLLIIVGNPHLLDGDKNWKELINFSRHLGSYRGCKYSPRREEGWMNSVMNRFENLSEE